MLGGSPVLGKSGAGLAGWLWLEYIVSAAWLAGFEVVGWLWAEQVAGGQSGLKLAGWLDEACGENTAFSSNAHASNAKAPCSTETYTTLWRGQEI